MTPYLKNRFVVLCIRLLQLEIVDINFQKRFINPKTQNLYFILFNFYNIASILSFFFNRLTIVICLSETFFANNILFCRICPSLVALYTTTHSRLYMVRNTERI